MIREVELKAVVTDLTVVRRDVERAGGTLTFAGRLEDRRYDTPERTLWARDHVLRLRVRRLEDGATRATIDWKGPTSHDGGYKVRQELQTDIADPDAGHEILVRLGYVVTRAIDREIVQYALDAATVRFESYPRMDDLVEVEGEPEAIERAIRATGIPREAFTTDRLADFVTRYEARTGDRAVLCDEERDGRERYDRDA